MPDGCDRGADEIAGDEIRLMWDYGVVVPLWDEHALLPEEPEWLRRVLHLSDVLIDELTRWGRAMEARDRQPRFESAEWREAGEDLRRRGRDLAASVQREVGTRYRVTYQPW
jgi:hypothetical protein